MRVTCWQRTHDVYLAKKTKWTEGMLVRNNLNRDLKSHNIL
jgi:hypothetical protein